MSASTIAIVITATTTVSSFSADCLRIMWVFPDLLIGRRTPFFRPSVMRGATYVTLRRSSCVGQAASLSSNLPAPDAAQPSRGER